MSNYKKDYHGRGLYHDIEDLQLQVQLQEQKQEQLQAQLQLQEQIQEQLQAQLQLQEQIQEQLQSQAQAQAQSDTDTSTFKNIGNPVVHVNVNEYSDKKKHDKIKKSAFRALKNTPTQIPVVNTNVKVSFTDEQFDLNNEYNSNTSTFVAKTSGVYLFTGTLIFSPNNIIPSYQFGVQLAVDGVVTDVDLDFTGFFAQFEGVVDISEILWLNAGQTVEIYSFSSTPGTLIAETRSSFAGAKIS